jgi:hypothetical protein
MMLLLIIGIVWLAIITLVVAICTIAAIGEQRPEPEFRVRYAEPVRQMQLPGVPA